MPLLPHTNPCLLNLESVRERRAPGMTTSVSEFTTNDGVKLVYEVGEGASVSSTNSPVVLVHGWSGSKHYFDHSFAALISAPNPPPKVVRYDLRGHGDSDKPTWGYHVARYAADLRDLLGEDRRSLRCRRLTRHTRYTRYTRYTQKRFFH